MYLLAVIKFVKNLSMYTYLSLYIKKIKNKTELRLKKKILLPSYYKKNKKNAIDNIMTEK